MATLPDRAPRQLWTSPDRANRRWQNRQDL